MLPANKQMCAITAQHGLGSIKIAFALRPDLASIEAVLGGEFINPPIGKALAFHDLPRSGHDMRCQQPLVQRNVAALHDAAGADGGLVTAVVAEENNQPASCRPYGERGSNHSEGSKAHRSSAKLIGAGAPWLRREIYDWLCRLSWLRSL
jgi:hypothetical protein